jgi:hypothetical protein
LIEFHILYHVSEIKPQSTFLREEKIPKEPSNYQDLLSGHEKHLPMPSETDHDALCKSKGNAVKDQHRNIHSRHLQNGAARPWRNYVNNNQNFNVS